jgi:hypothetical protein
LKVYRGIRDQTCRVRVIERDDLDGTEASYDLSPHPELFARPPGPFAWGSDSSGTLHLAAALLVDRGTDPKSLRALLPYMRRLLSRLPAEGFEVSESFLDAFAYAVGVANAPAHAGPPPAKEAATASDAPDGGNGIPRVRELDAAT